MSELRIPNLSTPFKVMTGETYTVRVGAGGSAPKPTPAPKPAPKPAPSSEQHFGHPTLKKGAKGDAVKHLQEKLNANGAGLDPDGDFGKMTEGAVKSFQKSNGLDDDGVVGKKSWGALCPGA